MVKCSRLVVKSSDDSMPRKELSLTRGFIKKQVPTRRVRPLVFEFFSNNRYISFSCFLFRSQRKRQGPCVSDLQPLGVRNEILKKLFLAARESNCGIGRRRSRFVVQSSVAKR